MATVVYQGLQSCLDSQLVESRMLRLRLSSPKPQFSQSLELGTKALVLDNSIKELSEKCYHEEISQRANFLHDQQASSNRDSGGWTCLQALYNPSQGPKETKEKESTYVHPLVKRSLSKLSEKSLELCTENLGCETGSDISENSIFLLGSSASKAGNYPSREQQKSCQLLGARKTNSRSFPPPLTTMSGSEFLQVGSHREDGRLVIKAVKSPSMPSCFQAERSNGRLRLRLVKDSSVSSFDSTASTEETEAYTTEANDKKEETENDMEYYNEQAEDEGEDFEEQAEEGNDDFLLEEEMDCIDLNGVSDMEMEEFQRPSRCKEGNNGLSNWEPVWVATS